jgi:transposase
MQATVSKAEYDKLKAKYNALEHRFDQLLRLVHGSKKEGFLPVSVPEQLDLWEFDAATDEVEAEKEKISYERKKKAHPGRTQLPENLPVEEVIIEPEEDTTGLVEIGQEVTETLDYRPGVLLKRRYIRKKYARPQEAEGTTSILIGELPERPIPKGIAEAGLLAHLFVAKYIDHLPFYRQIEMFKRDHGWAIHKSTINDWFAACCTLLEPLYEALRNNVLDTDYLQGDESKLKVLDHTKNKNTHLGWMWVFRNPLSRNVFFAYRKGRGANILHETLETFTGLLQSDGYSSYESYIKKQPDVALVSCLAHIRRKFFEAQKNHREKASYALEQIQLLYAIEQIAREENFTYQQRLRLRKVMSASIYYDLLQWVRTEQKNNLSKGAFGKALLYAKNHLPRLEHYLTDGRVEIDNNLIENKIRPLALGRKNYLFAGSHDGAQRAAMMYSFFGSCKANDVNPLEWLTDVLARIGAHPINQLEQLLPAQWEKNTKAGV